MSLKTKASLDCDSGTEFASEFNNPETSDHILQCEIIDELQPSGSRKELSNHSPFHKIVSKDMAGLNKDIHCPWYSRGYCLRNSQRCTLSNMSIVKGCKDRCRNWRCCVRCREHA